MIDACERDQSDGFIEKSDLFIVFFSISLKIPDYVYV